MFTRLLKYCCFIIGFISISFTLNAQSDPSMQGRNHEAFPYPYENFAFLSPRYDYLRIDETNYISKLYLRGVYTLKKRMHFRLDLPFAQSNYASASSNMFRLADISARFTHTVFNTGHFYWAYAVETSFPTASNAILGSGKWLLKPGIGSLYFMDNNRGSAVLAVNYQFSVAGDPDRKDVSIIGLVPNIDFWFPHWYIGYYPTWTYDFNNKTLDLPIDIEAGYLFNKNWSFALEYIQSFGARRSFDYEFAVKLCYKIIRNPETRQQTGMNFRNAALDKNLL